MIIHKFFINVLFCKQAPIFLPIIPAKYSNSGRIVLPVTHPVTGNIVAFTLPVKIDNTRRRPRRESVSALTTTRDILFLFFRSNVDTHSSLGSQAMGTRNTPFCGKGLRQLVFNASRDRWRKGKSQPEKKSARARRAKRITHG